MLLLFKRMSLMGISLVVCHGVFTQIASAQSTESSNSDTQPDPTYCNPPLKKEGQRCPLLRPPFFERERKPEGFSQTFLGDALSGMSDPLTGLGDVFTKPPATPFLVPTNPARTELISAPAILNVDLVDSVRFNPPPFPGQLSANGDFTFSVIDPSNRVSPTNLTFNVGTTNFQVNNGIPVTNNFINAVLSDAELRARLQSLGFVIMRQDASNIESVTVTPQGIPRSVPILFEGGGIMMGPIPDR